MRTFAFLLILLLVGFNNLIAQQNLEKRLLKEVIQPYVKNINYILQNKCNDCKEYNQWLKLFAPNIEIVNDINDKEKFLPSLSPNNYLIFAKESWTKDFQLSDIEQGEAYFFVNEKNNYTLTFSKTVFGTPTGENKNVQHIVWVNLEINPNTLKILSMDKIEINETNIQEILRDSDGDFVIDNYDLCSGEYGEWCSNGCPDKDGDCIANRIDDCPEKAGKFKTKGCPDSDNDGVRDIDEFKGKGANGKYLDCTYIPGEPSCGGCPDSDGDSVCDQNDVCPNELNGLVKCNGCSDIDQDNACDQNDICIDRSPEGKKGKIYCNGCYDSDDDGVCDSKEFKNNKIDCTLIPGNPQYGGCPDSDGDGIFDQFDECIDIRGTAKFNGCAAPQPPAKLIATLYPILPIPVGTFQQRSINPNSQNQLQILGFGSTGYGGGLSLDYCFNRYLTLNLTANYLANNFNNEDYNNTLQKNLNTNNIIYENVFSSSNGYSGITLLGGIGTGYFVEPHGIRIEPTAGIILNSFFNNELSTRINYSSQNSEVNTLRLFDSNPLVFGANLKYSYSWKKAGFFFHLGYLRSKFSATPSSFFIDGNKLEVEFKAINYNLINLSIGLHLFLSD